MRACVREKIASTCGDNDNEQCSPKIECWGYRMRNGTVYDDDDDDDDDGDGGGGGSDGKGVGSCCCCFWC